MGLGAEAVVLAAKLDQEEAEQRLACQGIGPGHLRLHQGLERREGIGLRRHVMQNHLGRHLGHKGLLGQAIRAAMQLAAQRIVGGHQLRDGALDQRRHHGTGKVHVATDVVQRRVALAQLVEPDVLLGGGEGQAGRQAG